MSVDFDFSLPISLVNMLWDFYSLYMFTSQKTWYSKHEIPIQVWLFLIELHNTNRRNGERNKKFQGICLIIDNSVNFFRFLS